MQRRLTLLLSALLALHAWGQADVFICSGYEAYQLDRRNIPQIDFCDSLLSVGLNGYFSINDIDSIVFREPMVFAVHPVGWFGDLADGTASYWPQTGVFNLWEETSSYDLSARSHFEMTASNGVSQQISYWLDFINEGTAQWLENGPWTQTGEKVKYVKSTLTRRRKFEMPVPKVEKPSQYIGNSLVFDYSGALAGRPSDEIQAIIYAWTCPHAPDIKSYMPDKLPFGSLQDGHYATVNYTLLEEVPNISCTIDLIYNADATKVVGDVMTLTFKNWQDAMEVYDSMEGDEQTTIELKTDYSIVITEQFEQTVEECMRDLVLFDIEWMRPVEVPEFER